MDIPTTIAECINPAPSAIVQAIIEVESAGVLYALTIASRKGVELLDQPEVESVAEAIRTAKTWVAGGYIAKIGLMQVSSVDFENMGISIDNAFSPCKNILAGSLIYNAAADHVSALGEYFKTPDRKLLASISKYKTGSPWAGIKSGYAARVKFLISKNHKESNSSITKGKNNHTKSAPSVKKAVVNPRADKPASRPRNLVVNWSSPVKVW